MKNNLQWCCGIFIGLLVCGSFLPVAGAQPQHSLESLVALPWEDYVVARDQLLLLHPDPWDIDVESRKSWRSGLLAMILNQRLSSPERFSRWDKLEPRSSIRGTLYEFNHPEPDGSKWEINFIFLVEKIWKGPTETVRKAAFKTLGVGVPRHEGSTNLWLGVWRNSDDDRLRQIALVEVCADPDPSSQEVILNVLGEEDDVQPKVGCLKGMTVRNTEQTVDAILEYRDTLWQNSTLADLALSALSLNSSPRARLLIHEYVLDETISDYSRTRALVKCGANPTQYDVDVAVRLLGNLRRFERKEDVLMTLGCWPIELGGPALRDVLRNSNEDRLVGAAAFALANAHARAKDVGSRAALEDITLLQSLTERDFVSSTTRVHLGMNIERIRGNRAELPDKAPEK